MIIGDHKNGAAEPSPPRPTPRPARPELGGEGVRRGRLPGSLSAEGAQAHDELVAIVDAQMTATEPSWEPSRPLRQMGAIVKAVNAKVAGRADGKTVAGLVKARINS